MSFTINIVNDSNGSTIKSYNISDADMHVLRDCIPGDQEILFWMENAIKSFIVKRRKIMLAKWYPIYGAEGTQIPTDQDSFIADIVARDDYVNKEEEEIAKLNQEE